MTDAKPLALKETERFSRRVEDYVRYRPSYPARLPHWLHRDAGVAPDALIADIGAGTGISTEMFLSAGHEVTAVEPNAAMREAADAWLEARPGYRSVAGQAEATGLADASVDVVTAAQAFHWFDQQAVRREWRRILKPGGVAAVFWNSRRLSGTPFLDGYEALLQRFGTDYAAVAERYASDEAMQAWFGQGLIARTRFEYVQSMVFDALAGRLRSSPYAPPPDHHDHAPMMAALRELFDACAERDRVAMVYDTRIFVGTP
ncbi:class I SAM-dependent methyltransferase [Oleiagrimonas sp. C23AA]|uniref:class I SAM-dependent methyltransferase n=1 Tax=Oleiagrimonas sp. C23AA TaxID=2719047 RepID=UPI001423A044|nr:class I SAM-dependent methyltransferase [Oleiagrimonas sp. C23AA]NII09361.1 class I SAM-dependent methyltransferase [Oleiagrimonas sp. C23AA]